MSASRGWVVLGVLYAAFFYWYTSFGGPLTAEEVEHYIGLAQARDGGARRTEKELANLRKFLEEDTGDDFAMVNVIEFRNPPAVVEGSPPAADAQEMIGRYMEFMYPELFSRACHPVIGGRAAAAAMDLMGLEGVDDIEIWGQAAMMRYRSRRDLMEIAMNPEFSGRHEFKVAAIDKTIAYPIDPWFHLGDPRLLLALLFLVIGLGLQVRRGGRAA